MGKELEYKLYLPDGAALKTLLEDEEIRRLQVGAWQETQMHTTYYDTPDRIFAAHHWTIRHRMEGAESVVCVKTPRKEAHTRGEFQICAPGIDENAIRGLLEQGAPEELRSFYAEGCLIPVCGARFLRRHVMLEFEDGSRCELAGDQGVLCGRTQEQAFCEVELELYGGAPTEMEKLLLRLCRRYGLREQPYSKFARARALK